MPARRTLADPSAPTRSARSRARTSPVPAPDQPGAPPEPVWDEGPLLNAQQQAFLDRLLMDPTNITRAYMAVYDCSYDAARTSAPRLLANARIAAQLEHARLERAARNASDADGVIRELERIASADLIDIWEMTPAPVAGEQGTMRLKPIDQWPVEVRRSIVGMKVKRVPEKTTGDGMVLEEAHEVMEIKFASKTEALRLLGLHHGAKFTRAPVDGDGKVVPVIQQTMVIGGQVVVFQ